LKNERGAPKSFKLPGRRSRDPITLKRGLTSDMTFWKWWQLVKKGKMTDAKTNISIIMYNRNYEALIQWDLEGAWPHKIAAPDFQAGSSDFGVEEITLVYARLNFKLFENTPPSQNGSDFGEELENLGEAMTGGIFDAG
jgi:phage tail-like protein